MNTDLREKLESYTRLHHELDETGGPGENGELFENIICLEEDILGSMDLPSAQKFREILWGDDIDAVMVSLQSARDEYESRPIKDPVLMLVDAILNQKDDPFNLLPMAGFTVHDYQLFIFSEKLLASSEPGQTDEVLSEMRLAEEHLGELGTLGIEGIRKNPELYEQLKEEGFDSLDEYLIHAGTFDLEDGDMDARQFYYRGRRRLEKEEYDNAIGDFTSSLWLGPDVAIVLYNRGLAFERKGDARMAVEDYSHAILCDSNYYKAYCNRGVVLAGEGMHERAIEDFTRAIELQPHQAPAYYNRAVMHVRLGDHERAVEDFTMVLLIGPEDGEVLYNRSLSYYQLGKHDRSIADMERAAALGHEEAKGMLEEASADDCEEELH